MREAIKISVIIPTYRRTFLLKRCIDSVAKQEFDFNSYEIVIVCDGWDAGTRIVVREFEQKYPDHIFKFTYTQKKCGPAAARNLGRKIATGELIVFTDDDCFANYSWLRNIWNTYEQQQSNIVAFTGSVMVPLPNKPTDFEKNLANLERSEFVTANCACSKKALEIVNGFDETFAMAWREDSDLHFKLLSANIPVIKINDAMVIHPVRNVKWGISLYEQKKSMYNPLLYKKFPSFYRKRIESEPHWNYYFIIFFFTSALAFAFAQIWLLSFLCIMAWLSLTCNFFIKRIHGTSKKVTHVLEMIVTSLLIPFLSVYWTLYGSYRFKKLLL
jgi:glycosyltransferase involved in cell wall biosynthesis